MSDNTWVFGYGSLIWRPDFHFIKSHTATLRGWRRVFWQGSHDHRGTPQNPGRVVTLIRAENTHCVGKLYLIDAQVRTTVFAALDHREKNGYERVEAEFELDDKSYVNGVVYIANEQNPAFLGEASLEEIAAQIAHSHGPSGANIEYALNLADSLRELNAEDTHVFELERILRENYSKTTSI